MHGPLNTHPCQLTPVEQAFYGAKCNSQFHETTVFTFAELEKASEKLFAPVFATEVLAIVFELQAAARCVRKAIGQAKASHLLAAGQIHAAGTSFRYGLRVDSVGTRIEIKHGTGILGFEPTDGEGFWTTDPRSTELEAELSNAAIELLDATAELLEVG